MDFLKSFSKIPVLTLIIFQLIMSAIFYLFSFILKIPCFWTIPIGIFLGAHFFGHFMEKTKPQVLITKYSIWSFFAALIELPLFASILKPFYYFKYVTTNITNILIIFVIIILYILIFSLTRLGLSTSLIIRKKS